VKDINPLPYRLPELKKALEAGEAVYIPEGEKDAGNLAKIGLIATTNHGGAGKWRESHSKHFPAGANVIILPDNDQPGRDHAQKIATSLTARGCLVRIVELPGLADKEDVSDWLKAGGTKEKLLALAKRAAYWTGETLQPWPDPEEIQNELLTVENLPPNIIPVPFRGWLTDIAHRMQCPIDFVAVGAIVAAGAIIGAGCGIRPKQNDDWLVIPNLWGGVVARPSMLKTPSLAEVLKPLARLEAEAKVKYEGEITYFEAEREANKAQRDALKSEMLAVAKGKARKGESVPDIEDVKRRFSELEEPEKPIRRRFKTNDATVEKVAELLNENPRGILLFRDELVGLMMSWDKEGRETDRAFYLEAWNGYGSFTTDRIGRGTIDTQNLCVSVLGGIQPSKLLAYLHLAAGELTNDGLIQRYQVLVYPDEPAAWINVDQKPDVDARTFAYEVLKCLANMDFMEYGAELPEGEKIPYYHFSGEAQTLFNDWLTDLQTKIKIEKVPLMVEHLSKYRSLMPSLALIFHLIDVAGGKAYGQVTLSAAEKAAAWCEYLESHARRIYGLVADLSTRAASELAQKIKKGALHDGFSARDIYRNGWHLLDKKVLVQDACSELIEAGWLREEILKDGKTRSVFRINPKILPQTSREGTDITDSLPVNSTLSALSVPNLYI
jgi:5S rRNA maturation endonuclease (ribonuclease M5)